MAKIFQISSSNLKILGDRKLNLIKLLTEDPQTLDVIVQNLVVGAIRHLGFVHSCISEDLATTISVFFCQLYTIIVM